MKKIKGITLGVITIMAAYLVFCSIGMTELPEWDMDWMPIQICMFVVGGGWITLFAKANNWFYEEDDEEWDM